MMNQQPDKFFREKLHSFQKPVSGEAWNRVSKNLGKKNTHSVWMRAAAAVLLLATATLLIFPIGPGNETQTISEVETHPLEKKTPDPAFTPDSSVQALPGPGKELKSESVADKSKEPEAQPPDNKTPNRVVPDALPRERVAESPSTKQSIPSPETQTSNELAGIRESVVAENTPAPEIVPDRKHVIIVFSAEEVNEKYLAKNYIARNTDAEATHDEKETSGIKKLLDKAYDLTQTQDPLGTIRQKKNEILAMNFRNEKQRSQND